LICADADIGHAAESVVVSKSYDNGLVCGAENHLVVVQSVRDALCEALRSAGAAVLSDDETVLFQRAAVDAKNSGLRGFTIGQSAAVIARAIGVERPYTIQLLVVPTEGVAGNPLAGEKMAPIVSLYTVPDDDAGIALSRALLEHEGTGHTAVIHTHTQTLIDRFASAMPASRILVNSPASHGIMGFTTGLTPSLTLGCGTFGRTSTTDNVSYQHLLNIKRVAHYTL
jgi:acetaldehyde dehydrogenase/alcohol dehydrogenase